MTIEALDYEYSLFWRERKPREKKAARTCGNFFSCFPFASRTTGWAKEGLLIVCSPVFPRFSGDTFQGWLPVFFCFLQESRTFKCSINRHFWIRRSPCISRSEYWQESQLCKCSMSIILTTQNSPSSPVESVAFSSSFILSLMQSSFFFHCFRSSL